MGKKRNTIPIDSLGNSVNTTMKIEAMYFALDVIAQVTENFSIGAGVEYLSGNDLLDNERKEKNAFIPLYGTNHKFNGWMDHFYVGNWGAGFPGLIDIFVPLKYNKENSLQC